MQRLTMKLLVDMQLEYLQQLRVIELEPSQRIDDVCEEGGLERMLPRIHTAQCVR